MPTKTALQKCIYCEQSEALTRDHVPPKILLPKPWGSDLVTVPACRPCNAGFQGDDEYFRATLGSRLGVDESETGEDVVERLLRALDRPGGAPLSDILHNSVVLKEAFSDDGELLGHLPAIEVDVMRLSRTLKRIVRGLYWHETRRVMPDRVQLKADLDVPMNSKLASLIPKILGGTPSRSVGPAFQYHWRETSDHPFFTAWLLTFYGAAQFAAITIDPDNSSAGIRASEVQSQL